MCEDADLIVRLLNAGGTVASGVGAPVEHLDWRSEAADYRNLRAYERGAGAWIGKLLREQPRAALPYLGPRLYPLDARIREAFFERRGRTQTVLSVGSFARGLCFWDRTPKMGESRRRRDNRC